MTTTEPEYIYVRGQGWVAGNPSARSPSFQLLTGEWCHFELRAPLTGEIYDVGGSSQYNEDGTPNWDGWMFYSKYSRAEVEGFRLHNDPQEYVVGYVTLVLE
jgi:hypothetical protein